MSNIANHAWQDLLCRVYDGEETNPRGHLTREILGCQTVVDMKYPVITWADRKLGYKFMAAEAAWILSGDNRVSTIKDFAKHIKNFSDDGIQYFGAYGPRFRDQVRHVIAALEIDRDSRQALVTLWRPNPPRTLDVPCTISLHWMIRNDHMHCFVDMRSSDVWLGVPYDWFNFTMMTAYVMLLLKRRGFDNMHLGSMYFNAHSQHLYERDFVNVSYLTNGPLLHAFHTPEFNPYFVESADNLVEWLWQAAKSQKTLQGGFCAT
jgi:thymidylate synthase